MENSEASLATDSFSYSWLVNPKPDSIEPLNDPNSNFSFDVSVSSDDNLANSIPLVHADKLFSNGLIMPVFATDDYSCSPINPKPSSSSPNFEATSLIRQSVFPTKFSRFSRKILRKYLGFLLPGCPVGGIGGGGTRRRSKRVDDLDRRAQEVKSLTNTPETVSPRMSTASAYSTWSDYAESSIYEAILYCKKSSEQ